MDNIDVKYTLDKLVMLVKVRNSALQRLERQLAYGTHDYGLMLSERLSNKLSDCHVNYTFELERGRSYYLGVQPNWMDVGTHSTYVKLEFNPAKVGYWDGFQLLHARLLAMAVHIEFTRFDIAIDFPVLRENAYLIKDRRQYREIRNSLSDRTEYLGQRSNHGQVKLYNKSLESKLNYPLTRLEITMDYDKSTFQEFVGVFPEVFMRRDLEICFDGLGLSDTEKVLVKACFEHSEYLTELGYRMRKKIECILERYTLQLMPNEILYKNILTDIMQYSKPLLLQDWKEIGDDFTELDFGRDDYTQAEIEQALTGAQIKMEEMK